MVIIIKIDNKLLLGTFVWTKVLLVQGEVVNARKSVLSLLLAENFKVFLTTSKIFGLNLLIVLLW